MSRHSVHLAFLGGLLWLACATGNPADVAPAAPAAKPAVASSGSCFRGNENHGEVRISSLSNSDGGVALPPTGGGLSRKDVRVAVAHYMHLIRKCYQAANLRSQYPEGQVTVGMVVAADGTVSDSWIRRRQAGSAEGDAELEDCFGRALCAVAFPGPKGSAGAVVYETFQFDKGSISTVSDPSCYQGHVQKSASIFEPARPSLPARAGVPDGSPATPEGFLDKDEVQGIIRSHILAVKACYERALSGNPALEGRVSSRFTIASDGTVMASAIQSSTMNDTKVEDCVGREICNWEFPKPSGGGIVIVSYPFNFVAGDASGSPRPSSAAGVSYGSGATVKGSLDKEIIRGVIRSHIPAVRACYELELSENADLKGRIAYQFTIAADGRVIASALQSSTMKNGNVEDCLGREIRHWEFPKPLGGGIVIVSYPFNFTAGDASATPRPSSAAGVSHDSGATVKGSLDKEIIRQVIGSHIPAVRACYEAELSANADLKGRIVYQFTIAADGRVIASALQSSTMKNGKVEDCVRREIRNWVFPKPIGGGIVIVSYPFNFTAGE
jgi:outer membrane biosynthesis protein TonB